MSVVYEYPELVDSDHLRRFVSKAITAQIWFGSRCDREKKRGKIWTVLGHVDEQEQFNKLMTETAK